ncbi:MAG TPA: bifunctional (p)ppGpp synthetase/guanosine-3',5'-bis(diphosphate) 3'-pyrophosphohydrolase [Burkholderiaceae bacterium]|jgi:RelA/SpoT family (p)ppGpp synthetase|nr:bifunctional (p)ppGpp synthetase/guanosine-3',5'-bis(diphosphate) 3'-pyrophosphohydrolase [Burkholderiaceae bacterium]HRZ01524.1 bifunctional (p)ppGpp synthetase/guanosine-3',5'-bis(diphosphate) 3'-pyrophosphohydrolase [Burkholderiaceae bacterium]
MRPQDPPPPSTPGFARRAAEALKKAVWRSAQAEPAPTGVATAGDLTARVRDYLPAADVARIKEAYRYSDAAHLGQFRRSGEPYITHPIAVAEILTEWKLDAAAIQAALLHDVLEDTGAAKQELIERFGSTVAELVDGVSKLDKLQFSSTEEAQAENFRKMLLAMARDVRVILIKLADRLHNMRTLDAVQPEKRRRIARETLEIYSPIAHRLGLNNLFRELQDLAFANLHPMRFAVLSRAVLAARGNRREALGKIFDAVKKTLPATGIKADVQGREKTLWGIYRKMVDKRLSFSEVLDVYGFRVIVESRADCYLALGALHALYRPVPGKFKDYIAIPKLNGYQSLHTTLIGPYGTPVEFQIRTREMHRVAESGVAAHWMYKDDASLSELQSRTHQWLQSLLEIQRQSGDSSEFLENIKVDLFPDKVYVFTPKGRIVSMPRGATTVDFAYSIHTDVGNKCVAARINGEVQPLRTELRNGDMVEIIAGPVARPNPGWLSFVRTGKARAEIRHYLRTMQFDESVELGRRLLDAALHQLDGALVQVEDSAWERVLRQADAQRRDDILADIGLGKKLAAVVARQLLPKAAAAASSDPAKPAAPILVRGTEGVAVQMGNCCHPIPGDAIVGHMRKGQGLSVHQADCPHARRARRADPERWIDLHWAEDRVASFAVPIDVTVANDRGVLAMVAAAIADAESNIVGVTIDDEESALPVLHFTIQVRDRAHLARVMRTLRRLSPVQHIVRGRGGHRAAGEPQPGGSAE